MSPKLKKWLTGLFFLLVGWLIFSKLREFDWNSVFDAVKKFEISQLLLGVGLAILGHAFYVSYDVLARFQFKHRMSARLIAAIAHVSYAFNLNFGSLIGGAGFRFRLYSRFGLKPLVTGQILAFSLVTNWLGYIFLLGVLLLYEVPQMPNSWILFPYQFKFIGIACLLLVGVYFGMVKFSHRRKWRIKSFNIELPSLKIAILQLLLSIGSWSLISGIIYYLLGAQQDFELILLTALLAAIAGAMTHVPAGIGVLEFVFITMLRGEMAKESVLASLLVYRSIFYLFPLAIAIASFFALEAKARGRKTNLE